MEVPYSLKLSSVFRPTSGHSKPAPLVDHTSIGNCSNHSCRGSFRKRTDLSNKNPTMEVDAVSFRKCSSTNKTLLYINDTKIMFSQTKKFPSKVRQVFG